MQSYATEFSQDARSEACRRQLRLLLEMGAFQGPEVYCGEISAMRREVYCLACIGATNCLGLWEEVGSSQVAPRL